LTIRHVKGKMDKIASRIVIEPLPVIRRGFLRFRSMNMAKKPKGRKGGKKY